MARILIADDEYDIREMLSDLLGAWGHRMEQAADGNEALRKAAEFRPDVVISDLVMPKVDGLSLLKALREEVPDAAVVILSGRGTIDKAVEAIHFGAFDFVEKPVEAARLRVILERACEKNATLREMQGLRRRLHEVGAEGNFIGTSPEMRRVGELVEKVAPSHASVIITGQSGTGKEVVARSVHQLSPRRERPFVAINCSAIPPTLIESELFGYEKGAFTGADQRRLGCFELADDGTLFLDEVSEIPLDLQGKFLRVIEEGRLRRLGGKVEIAVDVRMVCATNRDLKEQVRLEKFREDLFFRLSVFNIHLPPLKDRREDIPALAKHFIEKFNRESGKRVQGLTAEAQTTLCGHSWPGNIRELRNAVERALILCDEPLIAKSHLPPDLGGRPDDTSGLRVSSGLTLDQVEREYILSTLARLSGNKARTAHALEISEKTLYNKLSRYRAEDTAQREMPPRESAAAAAAAASA